MTREDPLILTNNFTQESFRTLRWRKAVRNQDGKLSDYEWVHAFSWKAIRSSSGYLNLWYLHFVPSQPVSMLPRRKKNFPSARSNILKMLHGVLQTASVSSTWVIMYGKQLQVIWLFFCLIGGRILIKKIFKIQGAFSTRKLRIFVSETEVIDTSLMPSPQGDPPKWKVIWRQRRYPGGISIRQHAWLVTGNSAT